MNNRSGYKIGVLLGGTNSEREISFESGSRVNDALIALGYSTELVLYEGDIPGTIKQLAGLDLTFIALHGGDGEDGTLQAALEGADIHYTGSSSGPSRTAMDKIASKKLMTELSIKNAEWVGMQLAGGIGPVDLSTLPTLHHFINRIGFPIVVKPSNEGSTVGLSIVKHRDQLEEAMLTAREFGTSTLVEKFIPGRELTVTVLDNQPLPIVEIVPKHEYYDYYCKYTDGGSEYFVPAEIALETTVAIQNAAARLFVGVGCRHYARVDFRLTNDNDFYCLEINTLPGMTSHSLTPMAASSIGIEFNELVDKIIQMAL